MTSNPINVEKLFKILLGDGFVLKEQVHHDRMTLDLKLPRRLLEAEKKRVHLEFKWALDRTIHKEMQLWKIMQDQ